MFEKFSLLLQKKLEEVKEEFKSWGIYQLGTEGILYTLLSLENSVCKHLFLVLGNEEKVVAVKEKIRESYYLRKDNKEYTAKFLEVIESAEKIALADESELIYDEHLLYSLLMVKNSVAVSIIKNVGISLDEILDSVKNIFELDNYEYEENAYLIDLSKEAEKGKLNTFIGRKKYLDKVIMVLSKKQKNNPMLIGNAGVGKSALVEGVALEYLKIDKDIKIYRLDIGGLLAGTKYRGDLEERLVEVIERVKGEKTILFIDEIHNIIGNNTNESSLDIANILKPILARNEIKCIGATTLDEYYKYIAKDKALSRRFQNIFIEEPQYEEMVMILNGIVKEYEKYYQVKYSKDVLRTIIEKSSLLTNRYFPDKAIDILDESGLLAKNKNRNYVSKNDVNRIVFELLGIDYIKFKTNINKKLNFMQLKKYYLDYFMQITNRKTIINILINNDFFEELFDDLKLIFNITFEEVINIDFSEYTDQHYASNLFGAPSGYVGYENGGILTEHVNRYPISVVIINNFSLAHIIIRKQIENILRLGMINDGKGRKISFKNCIFIYKKENNDTQKIGFKTNDTAYKNTYNYPLVDEVIDLKNALKNVSKEKLNYINKIVKNYEKNNYSVKIKIKNINDKDANEIINILKDISIFKKEKMNIVRKNDKGIIIIEN